MEDNKNANVYIIGAGISGLIAAIQLEKYGYKPVILEKDLTHGGRVQTDMVNGYQLDRGFQVLLDAYPKAKQYLDYEALDLQILDPGARLFENGKQSLFGDPLRNKKFLLPVLFSGDATVKDKFNTYQLKQSLQQASLDEVFDRKEMNTHYYLKEKGFSDKIIDRFFRPFFSGIYLEPNLETSSRMFEFVYKMFGEGNAVIPKNGIGAIAAQLVSQLKQTEIKYGVEVSQVMNSQIHLGGGEVLQSDFTIIATNPRQVLPNYSADMSWKRCDTLYFTSSKRVMEEPIIGLNKGNNDLINNIFYPTSIATTSKGAEELLSVTIVKDHSLSLEDLIAKAKAELSEVFGINEVQWLKHYSIDQALPSLKDLQYQRHPSEALITERIAIAGDHQLNASLNAAMTSGETAATAAHQVLANVNLVV